MVTQFLNSTLTDMKKHILSFALSSLVVLVGLAQDTVGVKPSQAVQLLPNQPKPLFILDDVELPGSDLGAVKPEDIEKIDVVKGKEATDKYGENGKNGVVIITTTKKYKEKKAKAGS